MIGHLVRWALIIAVTASLASGLWIHHLLATMEQHWGLV